MVQGKPHAMSSSKKTWTGIFHRKRLLEDNGIEIPTDVSSAGTSAPDDILDSAAAAWTARRFHAHQARAFGHGDREIWRVANGDHATIWA